MECTSHGKDTHELMQCLERVLFAEIQLIRSEEQLELAVRSLRECAAQMRSLTFVEELSQPTSKLQFDMSTLVDESDLPVMSLTMMLQSDSESNAHVPPELFAPLPSTIHDRVFPSFVGFGDESDYRACSLCGNAIAPSAVTTMSIPDAESMGSIFVCTCIFSSPWASMERPFDQNGNPTTMGLIGM